MDEEKEEHTEEYSIPPSNTSDAEGETEEKTTEGGTPPDKTPEPPKETPEEPCDPLIMNCDEMRDKIIDLTGKRSQLDIYAKNIDDTRKIIPSEHLDKAHDVAIKEKGKLDDEIYNIFEKFTVCTTKPQPELEKKAEEE